MRRRIWAMIFVSAILVFVVTGTIGGGATGVFRILLSPELMAGPTPLDWWRITQFLAWFVVAILSGIVFLEAWLDRGRSVPRLERSRKGFGRIVERPTAVMLSICLVFSCIVGGFEYRSSRYAALRDHYYDLCVKYSPKSHPELQGNPEAMAKFDHYWKETERFGQAADRPWAGVPPRGR